MGKFEDMIELNRKVNEEKEALKNLREAKRAACQKTLEQIRKDCKEMSKLMEAITAYSGVLFDTGIQKDGNPFFLSVWSGGADLRHREISNLHGWPVHDGTLPWLGLHSDAPAIFRFIEEWDTEQVMNLFYRKVEEELNKKRGEVESELESISKVPKRIRVTEIYEDGELVSKIEEAI